MDQARAWGTATHGNWRDYLHSAQTQTTEGARVKEAVVPETDAKAVRITTVHAAPPGPPAESSVPVPALYPMETPAGDDASPHHDSRPSPHQNCLTPIGASATGGSTEKDARPC